MLEGIATIRHQSPTLRLVNQARHVKVLTDMGLDIEQVDEMLTLLRDRGIRDDPSEIIEGPFASKPLLNPRQTRFSDGNLRVFYSALEVETAEMEIRHWYLKPLLDGVTPVRVFYRLAQCEFAGEVKDLRPIVGDWPFLIADDGYNQCNRVGAEAAGSGLAGLLSQSAQRPEGTTLPVFAMHSLSNAELHGYRMFSYDPVTGDVTVTPA